MLKYVEKHGINVEMGTNALNNVYVQPIKGWSDWKQVVGQLCRKEQLKEKYFTV